MHVEQCRRARATGYGLSPWAEEIGPSLRPTCGGDLHPHRHWNSRPQTIARLSAISYEPKATWPGAFVGYISQVVALCRIRARADRAAAMATLIMTAKLNDIDPLAWLADVLARIASHSTRPAS